MPDVDAAEIARAGRRHGRRFAEDVRKQMPEVDVSKMARAGRRQASDLAQEARSRMPNLPAGSAISRAVRWLFG